VEFVFVVPRRELFPDHYPQGFLPFGPAYPLTRLLECVAQHGFFVERARAEVTPEWKQLIPYNVVLVGEQVLLLRRTARGGEARLHDKLTIGVGGHLNPIDLDSAEAVRNPLPRGTRRELEEELVLAGDYEIEPIGLMNDDANAVGAVHVGVVQRVRVRGRVEIREKDVLEGHLVSPRELLERRQAGANFETWSAKLVDRLSEWLPEHPGVALASSPRL
jgi:predicted NUDIX family phosphoesterase